MADRAILVAPDTIRLERLLDAPVDRVWSFLVDADKRALWFADGPLEQQAGGKLCFSFDHTNLSASETPTASRFSDGKKRVVDGYVESIDPPYSLAFHWGGGDDIAHFALTPEGDRTRLVITHSRLPTRTNRLMVSSGWDAHSQVLAKVLAGDRLEDFWAAFEAAYSDYEAAYPAEPEPPHG